MWERRPRASGRWHVRAVATGAIALCFIAMAGCVQPAEGCGHIKVQLSASGPAEWGPLRQASLVPPDTGSHVATPCVPLTPKVFASPDGTDVGLEVPAGTYADLRLGFASHLLRLGFDASLDGPGMLHVAAGEGSTALAWNGAVVAVERVEEHRDPAALTPFRFGRTGLLPFEERRTIDVNTSWNRGFHLVVKVPPGAVAAPEGSEPVRLGLRLIDPQGGVRLALVATPGEQGNDTALPSLAAGRWVLEVTTEGEPPAGTVPRYAVAATFDY